MIHRRAEPELMDLPDEVAAYALADFAEVNARFVDRLMELASATVDPAGARAVEAIDLGCGPGDIARRVALARPAWRILAADASQPMLDWAAAAFARSGTADRVICRLTDAKSSGLPSGSFDVVYSNSLLHHLTNATAMWREVARIVRPGGLIFFRDLFRPPDEAAADRIVQTHAGGESKLLREEFHRSLLSAYTPEEILGQLRQAGLEGLRVQTVTDRHVDAFGTVPPASV